MVKQVILFFGLLLGSVFSAFAADETVPKPPQPEAYHYIEVPAGGLREFLMWRPARIAMVSHHRGGPAPGFPENAIETMQNALLYGPGFMEVDVAQTKDGRLILMHDKTLDRTTTGEGAVTSTNWDDISQLYLKDAAGNRTSFKVPLLKDVLKWAVGRAILTLDIKPGVDFARVMALVEQERAQDYVVAIAYSLDQAKEFAEVSPNLMMTVTMRNEAELNAVLDSGLDVTNLIAWTGTRPVSSDFLKQLHDHKLRVFAGTLGWRETSLDNQIRRSGDDSRYMEIFRSGVDAIATDRFWAVHAQIRNPNIFVFSRSLRYR